MSRNKCLFQFRISYILRYVTLRISIRDYLRLSLLTHSVHLDSRLVGTCGLILKVHCLRTSATSFSKLKLLTLFVSDNVCF
jgi:hypothetical protein